MSLRYEIYRSLFLALGAMEILTNLIYLRKEGGLDLARRQHLELPRTATDQEMKRKVVCMFCLGIMFFVVGLVSALTRSFVLPAFAAVLVIYVLCALAEAIWFRYWCTYGALILSAILLVVLLV